MQAQQLQVVLSADKKKLKPGELAGITAAVTGGKPDYTYTWTGNYAGSGNKVTVTSRNPGKQTLSLEVKDAVGAKGQAAIEIEVEGLKAAINGLKDRVVYGTTLALTASFEAIKDATSSSPPPEEGYGGSPPPGLAEKKHAEAEKAFTDTLRRLEEECARKHPHGGKKATQWYTEANRAAWTAESICQEDARKQAIKARDCVNFPKQEDCGGPGYSVPGVKIAGVPGGLAVRPGHHL